MAHKLFLTDETRAWLPRRLQTGMNSVLADGRVFLFTSVFEPPPGARAAFEPVAGSSSGTAGASYVLCALNADAALLPDDFTALDDDAVQRTVDRLVASWHPDLRRALAESDPASRGAIRFTASAEIEPWESSNVTVLGDAIHTMPPIGGFGGNTAMRDARLLCRLLASVHRGERLLLAAVRCYEDEMRDYGYAAIRAALDMRDQTLPTSALAAFAARTWFRVCRAVPALRRRTFGSTRNTPAAPRPWEQADTAA